MQERRRALGSDAILTVTGDDAASIQTQFALLWRQVDVFESRFSRFIGTSELVHFNQVAGTKVSCSLEFINILKAAKHWSQATGGVFNPFVLPVLEAAGYDHSLTTQLPAPYARGATRLAQPDELEIGENWARIPADTAIDLGGIGKGYLLDQLADTVERTVENYWLSFGGDIVGRGLNIDSMPWHMSVEDAANQERSITYTDMSTAGRWAIATSGTNRRFGVHDGKPWNHLIDPKTSSPSESDVVTATIVANSATAADVLASVVAIVGSREGAQVLSRHSIDTSYIQTMNGSQLATNGLVQWQKGEI